MPMNLNMLRQQMPAIEPLNAAYNSDSAVGNATQFCVMETSARLRPFHCKTMPVGCAPAACQVSIAENFDELKHVFFVLQAWVVIHVATVASEVSTQPLDSAISIGAASCTS